MKYSEGGTMTLYIKVTNDKYELPVAVADSPSELAIMLGLKRQTLWSIFSRVRKGEYRYKIYQIVEIDEEVGT